LQPDTEIFYKVDNVYSADHDRGLNWADPALAIGWPVAERDATLSERDRAWPHLRDLPAYFD
jgi:dTDP-4-dehydrorhamnose 3,5-epimerase